MTTANDKPDFSHDWQLIASPGHVLMARLRTVAMFLSIPFLFLFLMASLMLFGTFGRQMTGQVPRLSEAIRSSFVFDPNTYFDIGGQRVGPDLAFLADFKPGAASISVAQWSAIAKAMMADLGASGHDISKWTSLQSVDPQPIVTRPEKALSEYSKRLSTTGIITLPANLKDRRMAYAVAHIDGKWAFLVAAPGQCRVVTGPDLPECPRENGDGFNNRRGEWQAMKPKADK